ncbi:mCG61524, isoform CRA_b, partial [Mus musculus]
FDDALGRGELRAPHGHGLLPAPAARWTQAAAFLLGGLRSASGQPPCRAPEYGASSDELRRPRLRDTTRETAAARGWGPACAPPRSQLPGGLEGRSRALRTRGSRVSAPDSLLTAVRLAWGRCSGRPTLTCSFSNQPLGPRKQLRPWDQSSC